MPGRPTRWRRRWGWPGQRLTSFGGSLSPAQPAGPHADTSTRAAITNSLVAAFGSVVLTGAIFVAVRRDEWVLINGAALLVGCGLLVGGLRALDRGDAKRAVGRH